MHIFPNALHILYGMYMMHKKDLVGKNITSSYWLMKESNDNMVKRNATSYLSKPMWKYL